ncbi:MAG: hypothetical protein EOO47_26975 [Flavobacterium sp.]|nr:MAG: hypothetical protein EOO47_26975 [Flavobacterium sp.]
MKFLQEEQLKSMVQPEKSIEQFVGRIEHPDYNGFRWIEIRKSKNIYTLVLHEVFDDSEEIEDFYEFSYIEPDDIYGKEIQNFQSINEALSAASGLYHADLNKYLPPSYLNEYFTLHLR